MDQWLKQNTNTLLLRLNHDSKTKEQLLEDLKEKYNQIIVSQENAQRPHFHVLIVHTDSNPINARQNLRNFIKQKFNVEGNGGYAITETRKGTLTRLGAYVVKEGNYVSTGFSTESLAMFKAVSYSKYTKKEFQERLNAINERYLSTRSLGIEWFVTAYIQLKVSFMQNLNINTIVNYINLVHAKKEGTEEIICKVLAKFNSC